MTNAKGYAAFNPESPLAPFSFERRSPGPEDVVIDIQYCGVCHSDIHMVRNEWGGSVYPLVPGHEIVGTVKTTGEKVSKFKPGDHVGVGCFVDSCTRQQHRDPDKEQYLPGMVLTYNSFEAGSDKPTYGGYSDHIVVKEGYVLRIPDNLPLNACAPLLCAGITLWSPLKHWQAGPGKKVAILGMGGLGHMGVKFAHILGAEVTVLSHSLNKKQDGLQLGAAQYYATSDKETFAKLNNYFDLIICTVSANIDWNAYLNLLKIDGSFVVVGLPEHPVPVMAMPLAGKRRSISGSMIGSIRETQEMLDFCGKHNIVCDVEMISMHQINQAYERVLKSDVRYRFVIDMTTL